MAAAQTGITNVTVDNPAPALRERVELAFQLSQSYANPFDPAQADIRLVVTEPDATIVELPAFYYTAYDSTGITNELLVNPHDTGWRARFAPRKAGLHTCAISVVDANGTALLENAATFTCSGSSAGFIKIDPRDHRFLVYEDGTPYHPIGHNQAWAGNPGSNDYIRRFGEMAAAGQTWARVWMTHFYKGQSLEWTGGAYPALGAYNLQNAWRLDRIIESAEQNDIRLQLVLHHHGQFSTSVDSNWNENPYSTSRGGMLSTPDQFFTNAQAKDLTKRRIRYCIARWGYSQSILAWELFNEVQFTEQFRESATQRTNVANWHREMADYIKSIDVNEHLVTTSSDTTGFDQMWSIPSIDLIQVHDYGADQMRRFREIFAALSSYNKPIFIGEYGSDNGGNGTTPEQNPAAQGEPANTQLLAGLPLHNGMWAGAMLGGGAMHWYWDYIEARDFYDLHKPLAMFLSDADMAGANTVNASVSFDGTTPRTVTFSAGRTDFTATTTQTSFEILQTGIVPGLANLSTWLHGTFQSALRSDPEFTGTFHSGGQFSVRIQEVSGAGNNSIQLLVDGVPMVTQSLTNGATNVNVPVAVPVGTHTVKVRNNGQDWLRIASFTATNIDGTLVDSIGQVGDAQAWIWFFDVGSQYRQTANGLLQGQIAHVAVPTDGAWLVEFHATRGAGGLLSSTMATAAGGTLSFTLPDFTEDIAVKARLVPARMDGWSVLGTP